MQCTLQPAVALLTTHIFAFLTDGIHHSNPRFCLCVPPRSPPYLHRAPQVSWPSSACDFCQRVAQYVAVTQLSNYSPSKARMQKVSNISIFVMYIMYFLAALFGYLTFKGEIMFLSLKVCWKLCQYSIQPKLWLKIIWGTFTSIVSIICINLN